MNEERIKDEARKYANQSQFKSDFPHDWHSVNDGFTEGFKTALRLIEASGGNTPEQTESKFAIPVVESKIMVLDFYTFDTIEDYNEFAKETYDNGYIITPVSVTKWGPGYTVYFYVK